MALAIVASCRDHAPAVAGDEADSGMATFATLGDSTSGGDAGFDPCAIAMYGSLEVVDLALAGDRLAVGFDWNSDGVSDLALSSISGGFAWFDGRDLTADRLPLSL
ncbi:MAG: hypothetical protein K1X88_35965, partial [Nannocystaceae bacterium]|nr:hypothetical protein [Nannocystaceae bacterium]